MATYRKRGEKWEVQIRRKVRGQRITLTKTFGKKVLAQRWAGEKEAEIADGAFRDPRDGERALLSDLFDKFEQHILPTREASSHAPDRARLRTLKRHLGHLTLAELSVELRLRPGEYEKLRDAPHRKFTLINKLVLFAIETGMRRSEIANAKADHVDTTRRLLFIPESKTDWKTGRKGRTVPLSEVAIAILKLLPRFINGSLFGIAPKSISKAFEHVCEKQGILDLRFHDLRHEAVSRWFEKGFKIEEVAAMSGHRDWRSLKRYTHPDPEKLALRL